MPAWRAVPFSYIELNLVSRVAEKKVPPVIVTYVKGALSSDYQVTIRLCNERLSRYQYSQSNRVCVQPPCDNVGSRGQNINVPLCADRIGLFHQRDIRSVQSFVTRWVPLIKLHISHLFRTRKTDC